MGIATVRLHNGMIRKAEVHCMKRMASARRKSRSSGSWNRAMTARRSAVRFALCITDSEPDLSARKVYRVIPDKVAAKDHYLRVVDESGEDYLYPESCFVLIRLPQEAERAMVPAR